MIYPNHDHQPVADCKYTEILRTLRCSLSALAPTHWFNHCKTRNHKRPILYQVPSTTKIWTMTRMTGLYWFKTRKNIAPGEYYLDTGVGLPLTFWIPSRILMVHRWGWYLRMDGTCACKHHQTMKPTLLQEMISNAQW